MTTKSHHTNATIAFKRLFVRLALGLSVVMIGLLVLTSLSGPRLRTAIIDTGLVTSKTGQKLVLSANQPLVKVSADNVTVTPKADFTVATNADTVTITFGQRLAYETRYTVTIKDVAAKAAPYRTVQLAHSFVTNDPTLYYLKRSGTFKDLPVQADIIYATKLGSAEAKPVYRAPHILDYIVLDKYLVVSSADTADVARLLLVDKSTGKASPVDLPEAGMVSQLQAAGDGTSYGFSFTSQKIQANGKGYNNTLFVHDIRPGYILTPVSGIAGKPVNVINWQFAPDHTTIIAQQLDMSLLMIDGNFKNQPVPLGQYSFMGNFGRDGTHIVVNDGSQYQLLDLVRRSHQQLFAISDRDNPQAVTLNVRLLTNGNGYLRHLQTSLGTGYQESIEYTTGNTVKKLYDTATNASIILGYCSSPNDHVLVVETSPQANGVYDNYPDSPKQLETQTRLIEAATGKTIKAIDGSTVRW